MAGRRSSPAPLPAGPSGSALRPQSTGGCAGRSSHPRSRTALHPWLPQPQGIPAPGVTMVWPLSPAKPLLPRNSRPVDDNPRGKAGAYRAVEHVPAALPRPVAGFRQGRAVGVVVHGHGSAGGTGPPGRPLLQSRKGRAAWRKAPPLPPASEPCRAGPRQSPPNPSPAGTAPPAAPAACRLSAGKIPPPPGRGPRETWPSPTGFCPLQTHRWRFWSLQRRSPRTPS